MCNWLSSKYAGVVPLKDKKRLSIVNTFQKKISEGRKRNKIWVGQGSEFYNNSFKALLKINNIEMYSTTLKKNLLLLRDLLEHWKTRFLNTWELFQKIFFLMC